MGRRKPGAPYRIDFVLIVLTGNLTRYLTLRPLVEAETTVAPRWYPVRTWVQGDWLRFLPGHPRLRARHLLDSRMFFVRRPAEAVIMHALDTYSIYGVWHRLLRLKTVMVSNPDGVDYLAKRGLNRALLANAVRQTTLFVPWSNYTAGEMVGAFPEIAERMVVLHPGIPLDRWPLRDPPQPGERFRLLFVGGDAPRKGLDTLIDAFESELSDTCELDVATQIAYLSDELRARLEAIPSVRLHLDLQPGSSELKGLFARADAFVLPTRADVSSWVALESMATGVPVLINAVGGIPDIVVDGQTGLTIPAEDPAALAAAVHRLQASPALCQQLTADGRRHIEEHFDAHRNTQRLLDMVKEAVDARQ